MSLLFATLKVTQEIQNELISFMLRLTVSKIIYMKKALQGKKSTQSAS